MNEGGGPLVCLRLATVLQQSWNRDYPVITMAKTAVKKYQYYSYKSTL